MYIKYNDINYSCKCNIGKNSITYTNLPDDFPNVVEGEIVLCANDGFVMRTDNTTDYLRQVIGNGRLVLTNIPEIKLSEPVEVTPTLEERMLTLEAELEESKAKNEILEAQVTDTQLALCEVYEMIL